MDESNFELHISSLVAKKSYTIPPCLNLAMVLGQHWATFRIRWEPNRKSPSNGLGKGFVIGFVSVLNRC